MYFLLSAITGWLLGSIPTAYLFLKQSRNQDITKTGSGNMGAMNLYEVTGSKINGIAVMMIDALKGLLSVYITLFVFPVNFIYPAIALIFAVISHCYNPWLNFKGGRGLATAAGGAALIFPYALVVWLLLWALTFLIKKNIHFANIAATILTLTVIFLTSNIAFKYAFPVPDSISTLFLFTISLLLTIFTRHIEPLQELINHNKSRQVKIDE